MLLQEGLKIFIQNKVNKMFKIVLLYDLLKVLIN